MGSRLIFNEDSYLKQLVHHRLKFPFLTLIPYKLNFCFFITYFCNLDHQIERKRNQKSIFSELENFLDRAFKKI